MKTNERYAFVLTKNLTENFRFLLDKSIKISVSNYQILEKCPCWNITRRFLHISNMNKKERSLHVKEISCMCSRRPNSKMTSHPIFPSTVNFLQISNSI